tara:strand:+ start:766 stop:1119 length:354 start_codon:yes stop_codon:yes gene_type:complete
MMIINIFGLLLIGLIAWWFWLYKPRDVSANEGTITVTVEDGTYQPSRIRLPAGQPATIQFLRKDASPCAALVLFSDFDINEELPLDQYKSITLPAMSSGEYAFNCQMQMYRGTVIVE